MFISSIQWIDEENQEAEVFVSDGYFNLKCFSHPFSKNVKDNLTEPIYCLDVENVVIAYEQVPYVKKSDTIFGYFICGKFIDKKNKLILLGSIKLCLECAYIPNDIPEGVFVEFTVSRLSIY